jgi:Uma2 family endonuclease
METVRLMTVDDFDQVMKLPENRERTFELIDGEMVEKMPTQKHGQVQLRLGSKLLIFVDAGDLGHVMTEASYRLPGDQFNERIPDISFVAGKDTPVVEQGAAPRMPDLAVEIKSPDDTYKRLREKALYYLAHGVRLVWLVYPEKRVIEVYRPDADLDILTEGDTLDGGDLLPGFTLALRDIFA